MFTEPRDRIKGWAAS